MRSSSSSLVRVWKILEVELHCRCWPSSLHGRRACTCKAKLAIIIASRPDTVMHGLTKENRHNSPHIWRRCATRVCM